MASRRGADELISAGRVRVNGAVVDTPGARVNPDADRVEVDGRRVGGAPAETVTLLLHKPVQVVTTASDPQGRTTVLDLLPKELRRQRPFPVGRLDFFSEGLLLLTTDGDLCHRLTHPRYHLTKVYEVLVRGAIGDDGIQRMRDGMPLAEGDKLAPVGVTAHPPEGGRQLLEMRLGQGVNRQIRRMCRDLGLTILSLRRVSQGPISLGTLKPGKWRRLTDRELVRLRTAAGLE